MPGCPAASISCWLLPGPAGCPLAVAQLDDDEVAAPGDRVPCPARTGGARRAGWQPALAGSQSPGAPPSGSPGPGSRTAPFSRAIATAGSSARIRSIIEVTAADSGSVPGAAMAEATAARIAARSARARGKSRGGGGRLIGGPRPQPAQAPLNVG